MINNNDNNNGIWVAWAGLLAGGPGAGGVGGLRWDGFSGGRGCLWGGGGGYAVLVMVFWGALMLGGIFVSPRVERVLVVGDGHGI